MTIRNQHRIGFVVAALVFLLLPFFLPISAQLQRHPVIGPLGDQVHIPLLAGLTWLLYSFGPTAKRFWISGLVAALTGGAVEFLQLLVGRNAKWDDFLLDLLGIGLALCWLRLRSVRSRPVLIIFIVLLLIVPARLYYVPGLIKAQYLCGERFPLLADFESDCEHWLWSDNNGSVVEHVPVAENHGTILRLRPGTGQDWPGVVFHHLPYDWSDYRSLALDARCTADTDSVSFGIRLDDHQGYRNALWVSRYYRVGPQWQTVNLDLPGLTVRDSSRDLMLDDIYVMTIFLVRPETGACVDIDNVRLR